MLASTNTHWRARITPCCAEQFDELKAAGKLPFNQFPLLEMDGMKLTQSRACVEHIARVSNMYARCRINPRVLFFCMYSGVAHFWVSPLCGAYAYALRRRHRSECLRCDVILQQHTGTVQTITNPHVATWWSTRCAISKLGPWVIPSLKTRT